MLSWDWGMWTHSDSSNRAEPLEGDLGSIFQQEEREEPWAGLRGAQGRRRGRVWP